MLMDCSIEEEIYSLHKVIVLEHSDTDALFLLLLNFAVDNYWKHIVPVPFLEEIVFDMTLISVDFLYFWIVLGFFSQLQISGECCISESSGERSVYFMQHYICCKSICKMNALK